MNERALQALVKLCASNSYGGDNVEIRISVDKKFYINVPFDIKEGIALRSLCFYEDSIEISAEKTINAIIGKQIVFNAMSKEHRKEVFIYGGDIWA